MRKCPMAGNLLVPQSCLQSQAACAPLPAQQCLCLLSRLLLRDCNWHGRQRADSQQGPCSHEQAQVAEGDGKGWHRHFLPSPNPTSH